MRFKKEFKMCIDTLKYNVEIIQNIWDNEIKENDGVLEDKIYILLQNTHNILCNIENKTQDIVYDSKEASKFPRKIAEYNRMLNSKKKREGEIKAYDFSIERDKLPKGLLDSTITLSYITNYITSELNLTISRLNLDNEVEELFNNIKKYVNYTEDTLILDVYKL